MSHYTTYYAIFKSRRLLGGTVKTEGIRDAGAFIIYLRLAA